jgi:hypothetical protein
MGRPCNHGIVLLNALPPLLQTVAQFLQEDRACATGRAVLFASVVGFDVFESRIADIAAVTGISPQRLHQLVDVGRQALNPSSPLVHEQHLVSRVLLRQFCEPTPHGERLLSLSLQYGSARPRAPRGVGKREDFVKIDSQETEHVWGLTEGALPEALAAARTRRIFGNPKHVAVIKDAIALHFARSLDVLEVSEALQRRDLESARKAFLADPQRMDALFYLKHKIYPPASKNARETIADDLLATTKQLIDGGVFFRLRVVDMFHAARGMTASLGLQILSPQGGEFIIGDVPAIPIDVQRGALGLLGGVPFGNATMIVLPLGPKRLAALSRSADSFDRVPLAFVEQVNKFQISNAKEYVFMRPGSGLASFVTAMRPPVARAKP